MQMLVPFNPRAYFSSDDHRRIAEAVEAESPFEEMWLVASRILKRMPDDVHIVSGPITTGGRSVDENLRIFGRAIELLSSRGHIVFDQLAFHETTHKVFVRNKDHTKSSDDLLRDFYLPLFAHRKVTTVCFISGYHLSYGARWEHRLTKLLKHRRHYLAHDFETREPHRSLFRRTTTA